MQIQAWRSQTARLILTGIALRFGRSLDLDAIDQIRDLAAEDPRELRAQLAAARAELAATKTAPAKVETIKVPALSDGQIDRLRSIADKLTAADKGKAS